nr:GNAT family N-acetyltransferase [Planctomycetota bacterium]
MTTLRCAAMTEARARATAGWSYGAPYDIYDHPSWERMKEERWGLTDPAVRELEFVALLDDDDALAGFLRFMPRGLHPSVGLGLRPDLCGRGLGARALEQLEQEAVRRWGSVTLELSVRTFNE